MSTEITPDDLKMLVHMAEKVEALTEWAGRRVVVEVWDAADQKAVAWVEMYPDDSSPTVRFTPAPEAHEGERSEG